MDVSADRLEQREPRPAQAAHDGADRNTEDFRSFGVMEAGNIDELHHLAMQRLEASHAFPHGQLGDHAIVEIPGLLIDRFGHRFNRTHRVTSMLVDPGVANDPEQPRPNRTGAPRQRRRYKRLQRALLQQVAGRVGVPGQRDGIAEEARPVFQQIAFDQVAQRSVPLERP